MPEFLKRIKVRIALSFSLLFLVVAIPAIIYAFHQVNLFFEGMYLRQMRVAAQTARSLYDTGSSISSDSLVKSLAEITTSEVFLISRDGLILSSAYSDETIDTTSGLSTLILPGDAKGVIDGIAHKFVSLGGRRYLKVQAELSPGLHLLQVKSFARVTALMSRMREVIFWSSFLGLIALIAVAFWVSAKITGPLEELTHWALQIRSGKLAEKTYIQSPDEVGDLADALNDIVDYLNLAKLRLERLRSMRGEFFEIIRNELDQSVGEVTRELETLSQSSPAAADLDCTRLSAAIRGAGRMKVLVDHLISISEIEAGEQPLRPEIFSFSSITREISERIYDNMTEKSLRLELECPETSEKALILADRKLIAIALENIVLNAAQYAGGNPIKIGCQHEKSGIRITVESNTPSISNIGAHNQISASIDGPLRSNSNGSRLGLAVAMYIIEAHGQRLVCDYPRQNEIQFSFRLLSTPSDLV